MKKLNQTIDISEEFGSNDNIYFNCNKLIKYDLGKNSGIIEWKRYERKHRMAFNQIAMPFTEVESWEFPGGEYDQNYELPFSISFISERAIRIRVSAKEYLTTRKESSLMLTEPKWLDKYISGVNRKVPDIWAGEVHTDRIVYKSIHGSVVINKEPFYIELRDSSGKLITKTHNIRESMGLQNCYPIPFSFIRRSSDLKRRMAITFTLSPDEKIFGTGESFTRLDKRGQKIPLWSQDAHGSQTKKMYKPVPFFMSSRGYGMFVHTSTPITFDFGATYDQANTIYLSDDFLDIFIFIGKPKEILSEYTDLTGRSPLPPLWSFGLWMSRITYKSEGEVREVARKLRDEKIPCDVIHLDTGWFEEDWRCNYKFSISRFNDPEKMVKDLKEKGFRISLWQLPYFTPQNELYQEAVSNGFIVLDENGKMPTEDAIIDFSNPEAVEWYQSLLAGLFDIGVKAIKADFGEGAPYHGRYATGRSGLYEHNLYPLRYNKAVSDITVKKTGDSVIWARSAWAGSQRYPLHWSGDAENTDCSMAATLRAGLSLGLCGFSFWSHDIGGFVKKSPEELYRRWTPFGMLTSHSRCHGAPPKEPWAYSAEFLQEFRKSVELKYKLLPYIYTQAKICSNKGFPMIKTLFFEFPDDPTSWFIEDEYIFGTDFLIAPLFESGIYQRDVYLPPGIWFDYHTKRVYQGSQWYKINAVDLPIIIMVKSGSAIPIISVSQSTDEMNWSSMKINLYRVEENRLSFPLSLPDEKNIKEIIIAVEDGELLIIKDPYSGKIVWEIRDIVKK